MTKQGKSGAAGRRPRILVIGSFIMDLVVTVDRAPGEGETLIGSSFGRYPGGKGANQAVAAARLGADVAMVGCLGEDLFGEDQLRSLGEAGIDTSSIRQDPGAPSGVATIMLDSAGQNRIVIVPGANMRLTKADVDAARERIAAADFLMLQLEIPMEVNEYAVQVAAEVGTPVILNPAPAQPVSMDVLRHVAVLTPNEVESEQLTGISVKDFAGAEEAARKLLSGGVGAVAITLGERGSLVMERQGDGAKAAVRVPPYAVKPVDTVAAGDAFNGALAVRLAEGASLEEAARYASAVAAIAVTRQGAQPSMPRREEVDQFIAERSS